MDLYAIATAIATQYGTVVATSGSETESATATPDLPDSVAKLALLVYPPTGELDLDLGPHLDDTYYFMVRLLRDPLSLPARTRWLYAWANAMRTKVQGNMDLGLPATVAWAKATTLRVEIAGQPYSNVIGQYPGFDVVEQTVEVRVRELTTIAI